VVVGLSSKALLFRALCRVRIDASALGTSKPPGDAGRNALQAVVIRAATAGSGAKRPSRRRWIETQAFSGQRSPPSSPSSGAVRLRRCLLEPAKTLQNCSALDQCLVAEGPEIMSSGRLGSGLAWPLCQGGTVGVGWCGGWRSSLPGRGGLVMPQPPVAVAHPAPTPCLFSDDDAGADSGTLTGTGVVSRPCAGTGPGGSAPAAWAKA